MITRACGFEIFIFVFLAEEQILGGDGLEREKRSLAALSVFQSLGYAAYVAMIFSSRLIALRG